VIDEITLTIPRDADFHRVAHLVLGGLDLGEDAVDVPGQRGTGPQITFARSGLTVPWADRHRSLLDLADSCDVPTRFSCRSGVCHTCLTAVLSGALDYAPEPLERPPDGEGLICCSRPVGELVLLGSGEAGVHLGLESDLGVDQLVLVGHRHVLAGAHRERARDQSGQPGEHDGARADPATADAGDQSGVGDEPVDRPEDGRPQPSPRHVAVPMGPPRAPVRLWPRRTRTVSC